MKFNKIISAFILPLPLLCPSFLFGQQEKKIYSGFGIEEGAGYNTCSSTIVGVRNAFWIQPTARVHYSLNLYSFSENKKLLMPVFLGYYTFGGARKNIASIPEDPIYKEILLFRSFEVGINPCIDKNNIQIGVLLKEQYIFSIKDRTYGDSFWRQGHSMEEVDVTKGYKTFATSVGIKLKRKIRQFSIGTEAWFGVTNLYEHSQYGGGGKLLGNSYLIMFGCEF